MIPRRTAIAVIVFAAFLDSGGLKAGTPLAMASTPVRATEPPANALRSRKQGQRLGARDHRVRLGRQRCGRAPGDPREADRHDPQGERGEDVGRDREDVPGLAQAAQVADRDQPDRDERDLDPVVVDRRVDRLELLDRRGRRDRHRHDVVDEQGGRRDEAEQRGEVLARDRVRAAAVGIGPADLAVGQRDDRQQERDPERDLDRVGQRTGRRGDDEDPQDLLGRVGRRRDRVRAEDRQRLDLGEALADLLLARQGTSEDDRLGPGRGPARAGSSGRRPPPWRRAGRVRCSGSTGSAGARPGPGGRRAFGRRAVGDRRSSRRRARLTVTLPPTPIRPAGKAITRPVTARGRVGRRAEPAGRPPASPPGSPRCRRPPGTSAARTRSVSRTIALARGSPSRGWPTLPGLAITGRPSRRRTEPSAGVIVSMSPSTSRKTRGRWVWPFRTYGVVTSCEVEPGGRGRRDVLPGRDRAGCRGRG